MLLSCVICVFVNNLYNIRELNAKNSADFHKCIHADHLSRDNFAMEEALNPVRACKSFFFMFYQS